MNQTISDNIKIKVLIQKLHKNHGHLSDAYLNSYGTSNFYKTGAKLLESDETWLCQHFSSAFEKFDCTWSCFKAHNIKYTEWVLEKSRLYITPEEKSYCHGSYIVLISIR